MEGLELSTPRVEYGILFHGVPVGTVGYTPLETGAVSLDWHVRESYRGRGIAYEAARMMIENMDKEHQADLYEALIRPGNEASLAVARKLGFETYRITPENIYMRRRGGK